MTDILLNSFLARPSLLSPTFLPQTPSPAGSPLGSPGFPEAPGPRAREAPVGSPAHPEEGPRMCSLQPLPPLWELHIAFLRVI